MSGLGRIFESTPRTYLWMGPLFFDRKKDDVRQSDAGSERFFILREPSEEWPWTTSRGLSQRCVLTLLGNPLAIHSLMAIRVVVERFLSWCA